MGVLIYETAAGARGYVPMADRRLAREARLHLTVEPAHRWLCTVSDAKAVRWWREREAPEAVNAHPASPAAPEHTAELSPGPRLFYSPGQLPPPPPGVEDEALGMWWERTTTHPAWLQDWIVGPDEGCWECAPGSFAEMWMEEHTPEYPDCVQRVLEYLHQHENHAPNLALHQQFGEASVAEYESGLERAARDFARRSVLNDWWAVGDGVTDPHPALPPGHVPMVERLREANARSPQAQRIPIAAGSYRTAAEQARAALSPQASIRMVMVDDGSDEPGIGTAYCVGPGRFVTAGRSPPTQTGHSLPVLQHPLEGVAGQLRAVAEGQLLTDAVAVRLDGLDTQV